MISQFETDRLILKPTSETDAEFLLALLNTPKWFKYIGDRNVNSIAEAKNYIKTKMRPQFKRLGYSNYTVIRKLDQAKIGSCGLYDRAGLEGIDLGFAFLPAFEKKGYAFEAATKLISVGRRNFKIESFKAITMEDNTASISLLVKLGFNLKDKIKLDSEELLLYVLSKVKD